MSSAGSSRGFSTSDEAPERIASKARSGLSIGGEKQKAEERNKRGAKSEEEIRADANTEFRCTRKTDEPVKASNVTVTTRQAARMGQNDIVPGRLLALAIVVVVVVVVLALAGVNAFP